MSDLKTWKEGSNSNDWWVDTVAGNCGGVSLNDLVVYEGTGGKVTRTRNRATTPASDWGSIRSDTDSKVEGTLGDMGKHFRITYKEGKLHGFVYTLSGRLGPQSEGGPSSEEISSGSWTAQEGNRPLGPDTPPASE
jgi:hypothetical protein